MKLSVCIIARDCENTILDCLNSIKPYAKELVIVIDTRTKDNTWNEVDAFGCNNYGGATITDRAKLEYNFSGKLKIYFYKWLNDSFADARNFAISKCTGDWILQIDSDEVLVSFDKPDNECDYCESTLLQTEHQQYPTYRMFKNNIGIKYTNATHETIEASCLNLKKDINGTIIKNNKQSTPEQDLEKVKWLLERQLKELETEPENESLNYRIAGYYRTLGDIKNARDYALLSLSDIINDECKALSCLALYACYKALNKDYFAKKYLQMSLGFCEDSRLGNLALYEETKNESIKEKLLTINSKLPNDLSQAQVIEILNNYQHEEIQI